MTFWQALRGLGENPVYRLECRRQRRGVRIPLLVVGTFCCGCSSFLPILVAPAYAAAGIAHHRRARIWEDILLSSLSADEILAGMLLPALQVPFVVFAGSILLFALMSLAYIPMTMMGMGTPPPVGMGEYGGGIALLLLAALAAGCAALLTGGLAGVRAALLTPDTAFAVAGASLFSAAVEAVIIGATVTLIARLFPGQNLNAQDPRWSALIMAVVYLAGCALFVLLNAGVSALLWRSCARAIRG